MSILSLLITLIIWAIIFYVIWWALSKIALPEPFSKIATVIVVVAVVVVVIGLLTGSIHSFPILQNGLR